MHCLHYSRQRLAVHLWYNAVTGKLLIACCCCGCDCCLWLTQMLVNAHARFLQVFSWQSFDLFLQRYGGLRLARPDGVPVDTRPVAHPVLSCSRSAKAQSKTILELKGWLTGYMRFNAGQHFLAEALHAMKPAAPLAVMVHRMRGLLADGAYACLHLRTEADFENMFVNTASENDVRVLVLYEYCMASEVMYEYSSCTSIASVIMYEHSSCTSTAPEIMYENSYSTSTCV
ncbi:hypothetical protein JKP88DRAFT_252827 [Tribonema minus]|uniref:Uncharacterized protein n=1 Tax=Tribonema minus TaxID=303371 RepID=A0A835Z846_9STRA|nr:hypothetical protein JKP88DRAFT_252827 [Tribonema minus]